jgi:hypothetical protein
VVVVLLEERFFVLEERAAGFFDVDCTVVPVGFETVLLTVFAGVLLVVLTAALLAGRDADAPERVAEAPVVPVDAIANSRGAGFLAGLVARTARMALVCSSSVIRNS